jgi:hypothetical protein
LSSRIICNYCTSNNNCTIVIYRGIFQLTSVPVLSDVIYLSSIVFIIANGQFLGCATTAFSERLCRPQMTLLTSLTSSKLAQEVAPKNFQCSNIGRYSSGLHEKLTTHIHLTPRLRMSGTIPHSPTLLYGAHKVYFISALRALYSKHECTYNSRCEPHFPMGQNTPN